MAGRAAVAVYSLNPAAVEIALHEMGHTAYGLADEYSTYAGSGETGRDVHPPGEPLQPNITLNGNDRNSLKWNQFVLSTLHCLQPKTQTAASVIRKQVLCLRESLAHSKVLTTITALPFVPSTIAGCERSACHSAVFARM